MPSHIPGFRSRKRECQATKNMIIDDVSKMSPKIEDSTELGQTEVTFLKANPMGTSDHNFGMISTEQRHQHHSNPSIMTPGILTRSWRPNQQRPEPDTRFRCLRGCRRRNVSPRAYSIPLGCTDLWWLVRRFPCLR